MPTGLEGSFRPGMLNLADRGFFSMDRFCHFPAARADLAWRVKNSGESIPCKALDVLPDGTEDTHHGPSVQPKVNLTITDTSPDRRQARRRSSPSSAGPWESSR